MKIDDPRARRYIAWTKENPSSGSSFLSIHAAGMPQLQQTPSVVACHHQTPSATCTASPLLLISRACMMLSYVGNRPIVKSWNWPRLGIITILHFVTGLLKRYGIWQHIFSYLFWWINIEWLWTGSNSSWPTTRIRCPAKRTCSLRSHRVGGMNIATSQRFIGTLAVTEAHHLTYHFAV